MILLIHLQPAWSFMLLFLMMILLDANIAAMKLRKMSKLGVYVDFAIYWIEEKKI